MKTKISSVIIICIVCQISTFSAYLPFNNIETNFASLNQSNLMSIKNNTIDILENKATSINSDTEKELYLLHGRTNFTFLALDDVESFNFIHTIPPNYENQAPILFNIRDETTANIISYKMYNDTNYPNKVINFTIGSMTKKEKKIVSFEYWVLVKNKDYNDLPGYVEMPNFDKLPEETKLWLSSTKAIQSNNPLIKLKAKQLLRNSDKNLLTYAENIVSYTMWTGERNTKYNNKRDMYIHGGITNILWRMFPNKFQHLPKRFISIGNIDIPIVAPMFQDAVSTLLSCGVCSGVANLGTALFRAAGVPAKHLILTRMKYGVFAESEYVCHCISEFYCPGYGWVWAETTVGKTAYESKHAIVLRVSYPEDENIAGYGIQGFGGLEQWYWITDNNICKNLSTKGNCLVNLTVVDSVADDAFVLTQDVWEFHTFYFGRQLSYQNKQHYLNAIYAQQDAIECFEQLDFYGYFSNTLIAYNEYKMITL
jgi:hypothetical protein